MSERRFLVIGGGIAGLAAAYKFNLAFFEAMGPTDPLTLSARRRPVAFRRPGRPTAAFPRPRPRSTPPRLR